MENTQQNFEILFVSGGRAGERLVFTEDRITIGSSEDCRIVLDAANAKPHHASAVRENGEWSIVPEAGNVIVVNNSIISDSKVLASGDIIAFGSEKISFCGHLPVGTVTFRTGAAPAVSAPAVSAPAAPRAQLAQESAKDVKPSSPSPKLMTIKLKKTESAPVVSSESPVTARDEQAVPPPPPPPPPLSVLPEAAAENIFADKGNGGSSPAANVTFSPPPPPPKLPFAEAVKNKKTLLNLLIAGGAALLVCILIAVTAFFVFGEGKTGAKTAQQQARAKDYVIYYERDILKGGLVYRFTITLSPEVSSVSFLYSDGTIVEQILYDVPEDPVPEDIREEFFSLLDQTDMNPNDMIEDVRIITFFLPDAKHTVGVVNFEPPESFAAIENIIFKILADNRPGGVLPSPVEEDTARQSAMDHFLDAEAAAADADSNSAKFIEALNNYRLAVHYFRCFSGRPREYSEALAGVENLDAKRELRIQELENEVEVQSSMRDADKLHDALLELRYLYPEDSREHKKIREQIFKLQSQMQGGRRRK